MAMRVRYDDERAISTARDTRRERERGKHGFKSIYLYDCRGGMRELKREIQRTKGSIGYVIR